jgi:hypothetical protein
VKFGLSFGVFFAIGVWVDDLLRLSGTIDDAAV